MTLRYQNVLVTLFTLEDVLAYESNDPLGIRVARRPYQVWTYRGFVPSSSGGCGAAAGLTPSSLVLTVTPAPPRRRLNRRAPHGFIHHTSGSQARWRTGRER